MKVLVTGAAGFIGAHVVRDLLERGHSVHALVRPASSIERLQDVIRAITVWPVDLLDGPALESAISAIGAEAVIHLAWYAEPGSYLNDVPRNLASLEASVRLLRLLTDGPARRLVLAGTCLEDIPSRADEPAYAVAKRALHQVAVATSRGHPTVACAHVFSVFGPGEDPGRALPSIIRSLLDGRPVDVGAGTQLRDYVHVEDVAAGLVTVLESGTTGGVDVCLGRARPLREVFEEVGRATGAPDLVHFGARADRPHELFDAVGSPATLRALGWRPARSFAERIDETVAWWRSHSDARFAVGSTR